MIEIKNISACFGAKTVVQDISFTAPANAITAVLGESGSGKSTLLRVIAGLERASAGEVLIEGRVVTSPTVMAPPETRAIGFVFQDFALFPHMRAAENVAFGLAETPVEARAVRVQSWLQRVGLEARAHAFPHQLSGGEQQRIALARALAPRPRVALLDEPFSSLDPSLRGSLRDMTKAALRESGAAAIFVTHDADEALYMADQIAVLKDGRLLQCAAPEIVYDRPASAAVAAALGPVTIWRGRVANNQIATPFGVVTCDLPDGAADLVVRAEALLIAAGPSFRVTDRHLQGAMDLASFETGGAHWRALCPRGSVPGETFDARLCDRGVFVFPA
jgi:iron(III) transport system ATP-binding protein